MLKNEYCEFFLAEISSSLQNDIISQALAKFSSKVLFV